MYRLRLGEIFRKLCVYVSSACQQQLRHIVSSSHFATKKKLIYANCVDFLTLQKKSACQIVVEATRRPAALWLPSLRTSERWDFICLDATAILALTLQSQMLLEPSHLLHSKQIQDFFRYIRKKKRWKLSVWWASKKGTVKHCNVIIKKLKRGFRRDYWKCTRSSWPEIKGSVDPNGSRLNVLIYEAMLGSGLSL